MSDGPLRRAAFTYIAGGKYVTSSTLGLFELLSDSKPSGMSFYAVLTIKKSLTDN